MQSVRPSIRVLLALATLCGALAVALGALGGHAMQSILAPEQLDSWDTATRYLMWHALAALAVGLARQARFFLPAFVLLLGVLLFSGSLYLWLLSGFRPLVFVTPLGGLVMLVGWFILFWKTLQHD